MLRFQDKQVEPGMLGLQEQLVLQAILAPVQLRAGLLQQIGRLDLAPLAILVILVQQEPEQLLVELLLQHGPINPDRLGQLAILVRQELEQLPAVQLQHVGQVKPVLQAILVQVLLMEIQVQPELPATRLILAIYQHLLAVLAELQVLAEQEQMAQVDLLVIQAMLEQLATQEPMV